MKRYLLLVLMFTIGVYASYGNYSNEKSSVIGSPKTYSPAQVLENLSQSERENAIVDIICSKEAEKEAKIIEEKWNSGEYEEAIKLLKNSSSLKDAGIGIQWKNPIITQQKWGNDVIVSTRDSIKVVDMDVDNATGHIFVVLMYQSEGKYWWSVNMSTDTGRTWQETYALGNTASDVDCAVLGEYLYVAFAFTDSVGYIERFFTSDGSRDNGYHGYRVIDEGVRLKDIVLISSVEGQIYQYLLYFAILENDSLRLYYSTVFGTSWLEYSPSVGNVDRGLDASYAFPDEMWVSYIGTDDSLYVLSSDWSSWSNYGPLYYTGAFYDVTSIGAHRDTVIVVFPYYASFDSQYVFYKITYDGGQNWYIYYLYGPSFDGSYTNDVTARFGDGIGVVYNTSSLDAEAFYRHRGYSTFWSDPINIADSAARYNVKPSIERIADGIYGIVYVNYPEEIALFDRSDWITGIEEDSQEISNLRLSTPSPTVFSKEIQMEFTIPSESRNTSLDVYSITGRHIKNLFRGRNKGKYSVIWFGEDDRGRPVPSGNYLCILRSGGERRVLKLTLVR